MTDPVMKDHILVIFTSNYPYDTGEEFFSGELEHLKTNYSIEIVPVSAINLSTKRTLEFKVNNWLIDHLRIIPLLRQTIASVFSVKFYEALFIECRTVKKIGVYELKRLVSQYAKARIAAKLIRQILQTNRNRQVIFYSYWLDFPILGFKFIKKTGNYKVIARAHGIDLFADQNIRGYVPLQLQKIALLDKLILVSDSGMRYLLQKYGNQLANKLVVSKLGVTKMFPNHLQYDVKNLCLISISSCVEIKRINLIIDLIAKVREYGVDLTWQHIGYGDLFDNMEEYAALKLKKGFLFHGYQSNYEVQGMLATNSFAALISCSFSEGGNPVSMQEAQAYGLPIIATDVGGVSEVFEQYDCGWLIERDFVLEDVAAMLAAELCNPELRLIKSDGASRSFISKYQAEVNYSEFCRLLQEL